MVRLAPEDLPYTEKENALVRRYFPYGGYRACKLALPDRTLDSVQKQARILGVINVASKAHGKHNTKPEPEKKHTPKTRQCLRCSRDFRSNWIGNRVCRQCKSSSDWSEGMPLLGPGN
jgi:hypothetical protein